MTYQIRKGYANANGTQLYHEIRGSGPSLLFISGATGDAGHYERVAELLADDFTVVSYDRRGNSRSPRPAGWSKTSKDEQADDAAGLLQAVGLAPAAVFGNSGGATIALSLLIRHPEVVRGAILHELVLPSVLAKPEETMEALQSIVSRGMAAGGPRGAVEAFVRSVAGDAVFEALDPQLRERMLGNADTLFGIEFEAFASNRPPDDAVLFAVNRSVQVMVGTESRPWLVESARWLAQRLKVEVVNMPGAHTPYFDHPQEMADAIRLFFSEVAPVSRTRV